MPNWCSNSVTFTHPDRTKLQQLVDAYNVGETMDKLFPCPTDLRDTVAGSMGHGTPEQAALEKKQAENIDNYGAKDWYDWCVDNWGTKWDFGREDGRPPAEIKTDAAGEEYVELGFDTAWAPPLGFYAHLTAQGFRVKAYYFEGGMGFCGVWHDNLDDAIDIREFTQEWVADHVPAKICEVFNLYEEAAQMEEAESAWREQHSAPNSKQDNNS